MLLLLCFLWGCEAEKTEETVTCVSSEDCFLCGRGEKAPWGQNNVGLISLNTFEMLPVEINRYSNGGELIETRSGCVQMQFFWSREDGFRAFKMEDSDRGYATLSVTLGEDRTADRGRTAGYLCEDCLEKAELRGVGLGAVNLASGEIRALDRGMPGFSMGDFYVHCDWEEEGEGLELMIFYSPVRYEKEIVVP